ncbi:calcium-translocating P-type ATPase, SERCA-type [Clostridium sp. SHJSY1]|uniref:calcium-translocating P-type ATPase, SERCA-type n=1 Tax=Clostridium sp. SHJSY1 TaxID=2942483 RepID=UPI002874E1DE|nr:calcium-translocating P-type ATPase, SERCA-type [Clostridium sp. SHJSY1]MDS0524628.1 calcium-translocating P-type ATPase, SERCA-type [Clostridium sp. SHJSY1]
MWFNKNPKDVITELSSHPIEGLSSSEAEKRLERDGKNKLAGKKKKTLFALFLSQINDAMIYILIGAAIIAGIMGEISDSIIILIVILINAIIGIVQESKAEKALEALKQLSTPKALVKRDGVLSEIPSEDVVVGDIVIIDAGRYIPADLRLIESANLKIEESAFTGESLPAEKDANIIINEEKPQIGDIRNMAFMSTLATYGRGSGIVVATGMNTEIGKIAKMLDEEEESSTPLQKKLADLGKTLGFAAVGICIIIFILSMFQGRDWFEMLLTAISLAVAAIPEGLPAIVAIVLALGVQRMIKENAIVKKLPAVETLGSVSIICSDKTGTLTINRMTVKKTFVNNKLDLLDNVDLTNPESRLLVEGMVLCNDATSTETSKTGDPTEIALLDVGNKFNIFKDDLNEEHKRINEIPFDSDRKLMTTLNVYGNKYKVFTKGAIDSLFTICSKISINGTITPLTDDIKEDLLKQSNLMSDDALRVLGLAYKDLDNHNIPIDKFEDDLIFIGLMGMIDPPREEVKDSINLCKKAGITPIMITGDHKNTAFAIANELHMADDISECMAGSEIDKYEQDEFYKIVPKFKVFARVSPEHKVKIVKAFKSHGNIVSMTGDGVNDAPSLKAADIGVAMGITGTDVAKGAADMILTDDNFSTIVNAVEEGRNIYNNIKKSIIFLLSCNFGEIVALFVAILLNWESPLLPIHILWVNLITDSFPALSLGVDPMDESVMEESPRNPKETLFAGHMGLYLAINGVLIGALTLFAFKFGERLYPGSLRHAQTLAFVVLSASQLFFSLNMRSTKKSIFKLGIFSNKYLIASFLFGLAIQFTIITIPFLANVFKVYSLTLNDWILVISISAIPLIVNELLKIGIRNK